MPLKWKPSGWPTNVQYSDSLRYHSSATPEILSLIQGSPQKADKNTRAQSVLIRRISDENHPACGQYGLFAAKKIPPKTYILDYVGEVHCDERPQSDYDLSLYRSQCGADIGIDASVIGNEARFINDFRGVREKPNAIFTDERSTSGELRMSVWSMGGIRKGEEILVSYGKAWWKARDFGAQDIRQGMARRYFITPFLMHMLLISINVDSFCQLEQILLQSKPRFQHK